MTQYAALYYAGLTAQAVASWHFVIRPLARRFGL
jgi:hypothetical protein